jgi:hypothetical protein
MGPCDLREPLYLWDQNGHQTKEKDLHHFKKKRTPLQGDLYKKFFSRGLGALAHH